MPINTYKFACAQTCGVGTREADTEKYYKAQFADCVLSLCVIDEIVIDSMSSGRIMEIRPSVS